MATNDRRQSVASPGLCVSDLNISRFCRKSFPSRFPNDTVSYFSYRKNSGFFCVLANTKPGTRNKRSDQSMKHPMTRVLRKAPFCNSSLLGPPPRLWPASGQRKACPHMPSPCSYLSLLCPPPRSCLSPISYEPPSASPTPNAATLLTRPSPVCSAQHLTLSGRGREPHTTLNFEGAVLLQLPKPTPAVTATLPTLWAALGSRSASTPGTPLT